MANVTITQRNGHLARNVLIETMRIVAHSFWQVHRGTVVNVHAIKSVSRSAMGGNLVLNLKNRAEKLQVSASYAHLFKHM